VVTDFVVNAPDRLALDVHGGTSSRLIGDRRWDKLPGTTWQESKTVPVRVPDPFWGVQPLAAHVLTAGRRTVDVTLVRYDGRPTWFRVRIQRSSGRVLAIHMVTAAHFMVERYSSFDSAPRVLPP